jgi:hypothetical protein
MPRLEESPIRPVVGESTEIEELALLLSTRELASLEQAACRRSLSTARLLRCLIEEFLYREAESEPREPG